jgi:hypothetical protein
MAPIDFAAVRRSLATFPSDHDASGTYRPTVPEIYAPEQHASALDPNTPIVVGARGTGKSFWAGVLEQDDTRAATAIAYPRLRLDKLLVTAGYTGLDSDTAPTPKIIDSCVPEGHEISTAFAFWQAVVLRAAKLALSPDSEPELIREVMKRYSDPELVAREFRAIDDSLNRRGRTLLIIFDALDTISKNWNRSSLLVDALFEVIWALRVRRSIRTKIFIRPEQLNDNALRFVELPKLRSGRVELEWNQLDLYGLLYWRLSESSEPAAVTSFRELAREAGAAIPSDMAQKRRSWVLLSDQSSQEKIMLRMAGQYMGRGHKKGGTYDWPYRHLADAKGQVTPRSFIKLFVEAAKFGQSPVQQVISAEGIRHGLRQASKVRVDQLAVEYKWVSRALAPLAGMTVPCEPADIYSRWTESNTVPTIIRAASDRERGFLPPFPPRTRGDQNEMLAGAMERIGVFASRSDGRIDIPDLFRVAAQMLKKGGTPPKQRARG